MSEMDTGLEELLETGLHWLSNLVGFSRPRSSLRAFDQQSRHPMLARIACELWPAAISVRPS